MGLVRTLSTTVLGVAAMVVAAVVAGTAAAVQASQQGPPVDVSIKIQSTLPLWSTLMPLGIAPVGPHRVQVAPTPCRQARTRARTAAPPTLPT